ncbi:alpha/beta hydrolase [Aquibacillus salsiterrae]|uniref:Lysophospholipase n=1 Tax=Aquibacillus salsiterrae TaxID=2950439 RepID=A0A9X3WC92_9BACI|nr:alpha/beta hydrolase [Aquibacillus salsiterrae]MDC3416188.1 lysophospholipase [Aquibacillus salsiterrae]
MPDIHYWLPVSDGVQIFVKGWTPLSQPKAIVQIAHGMVEHIDRYDGFARYLTDHQIAVVGNDHRGHGKTGEKTSSLGVLADADGFEKVVEDLLVVTKDWQTNYPGTPIFLLGHSFGSFLARRFIQKYSDRIDGVILIGTGQESNAVLSMSKLLANFLQRNGKASPSYLFNRLIFGQYKKTVRDAVTDFDWLTRDQTEVTKYLDDQHTGFIPSTSFFHDMFDGMINVQKKRWNEQIRKDLPILLLSGERDPVTKFGKGQIQVATHYHSAGIDHVQHKVYSGARHELLNETNKREVYQDIVKWITEQI